jgi:HlyD family secretion protein
MVGAMANPPTVPATASVPARSAALGRLHARRRPWWILIVVVVVALAAGAFVLVRRRSAAPAPRYLTATVTRGDVAEAVRATGTVRPVLEVQVGAQISGRVTAVAVDFNSRVRQGDLLAELDATPYRAQAAQVRASLSSARAVLVQRRAELTLAELTLARATALRAQGLNAQADVDASVASRDSARASVGVAQAQVEQATAAVDVARTNLTYTRILAPIDGIVATRGVDPGQTVAASLQTPTLFIIVNDLAHMRVIANVDEANIGKLTEGMEASARVDAFPRDTFRGTVRELRITPTTTNGVVTYQAVIDVDNPQSRLRPGMTATVTAVAARHPAVLRVPNAALRYRPAGSAAVAALTGGGGGGGRGGRPEGTERGGIYVLQGERAVRVPVAVGLTDGVLTEVTAPTLVEGARVVVDETDAAGAAATPAAAGAGARAPRTPRVF